MAKDFYSILGVHRHASAEELKRAYKQNAMKWHPDRNPSNLAHSQMRFQELSEAYQVLSDPKKKAIYDKFGVEGIKSGMKEMPRNSRSGSRGFEKSQHGYDNPNGGWSHVNGTNTATPNQPHSSYGHGLFKQKDTEMVLHLTLEELFKGVNKRIKIIRNVFSSEGQLVRIHKVHEVVIKPGFKGGTRIRYLNAGNEAPKCAPGDVVFVINEKKHTLFSRHGNDLEIVIQLSLVDALTSSTISVPCIDGNHYRLDLPEVINPETVKTITGAGMPLSKNPEQRGDMRVKFNIIFPLFLKSERRKLLHELLS